MTCELVELEGFSFCFVVDVVVVVVAVVVVVVVVVQKAIKHYSK
jgi:hypothetical protein